MISSAVEDHRSYRRKSCWIFLTVCTKISKLLRKLTSQQDLGFATVHKALRKNLKMFLNKIMTAQKLKAIDQDKQVHY